MLQPLMRAINVGDEASRDLLDHPNVTFVLRACLKSVVDGQSHIHDFAYQIVTALSDTNLDLLRARKSNFIYAYKLIMWTVECCSLTQQGREDMAGILRWCSSKADRLIGHKYGNILLQHVIVYGK